MRLVELVAWVILVGALDAKLSVPQSDIICWLTAGRAVFAFCGNIGKTRSHLRGDISSITSHLSSLSRCVYKQTLRNSYRPSEDAQELNPVSSDLRFFPPKKKNLNTNPLPHHSRYRHSSSAVPFTSPVHYSTRRIYKRPPPKKRRTWTLNFSFYDTHTSP